MNSVYFEDEVLEVLVVADRVRHRAAPASSGRKLSPARRRHAFVSVWRAREGRSLPTDRNRLESVPLDADDRKDVVRELVGVELSRDARDVVAFEVEAG